MSIPLVLAVGLGPAPVEPTTTAVNVAGYIPGEVIPIAAGVPYVIDLAMMPAAGLQGLTVVVDTKDKDGNNVVAPTRVTFTPGGYVDMKPGGSFALSSPGTAAGITALSLSCAVNARATVTAGG